MAKKKSKEKKAKKPVSKTRKVILVLLVISAAGILIAISDFYKKIYYPNINLIGKKDTFIYIPTSSSYDDVFRILVKNNLLINYSSFEWVASSLGYKDHVHPGKYLVKKNMNNKDLVLLLRSGKQTPVRLVLNTVRTKDQLISKISHELECDSSTMAALLSDPDFTAKYGFSPENIMAMFIPNTYEFYWTTGPQFVFKKIYKAYQTFWNDDNIKKAESIGLDPVKVCVLASIVEQETNHNDEKPVVAGVYMNRLHKGYKLEADPTLVFALGDFTIRRVLNAYKSLDSPYNTYMYEGLPPGPICLPTIPSLKAVLNYQRHSYLYFCAKEDFSGYHNFAKTYVEHLLNARKYQKELNRRNIKS